MERYHETRFLSFRDIAPLFILGVDSVPLRFGEEATKEIKAKLTNNESTVCPHGLDEVNPKLG